MLYGASSFIWVSPFSNETLDILSKIKDFGFDYIEICIEDPKTIDTSSIKKELDRIKLSPLVAGALVNKMHQFGGVDHKLVQDLAHIQSSASKDSTVGTAVTSLAKNIASIPKGAPALGGADQETLDAWKEMEM